MRTKPLYKYRITDRIFIIYKLSNYARINIKEIHAGVAFDDTGNYTDKFNKLRKKYNLGPKGIETTSDSHKDFCSRLYIMDTGILSDDIKLPSNVRKLCKAVYERNRNKKKEYYENKECKNDICE